MKHNRSFIPLISVPLFLLAGSISATTVEEEFSICAAAAMESQLPEDVVFHVDLSELESIEFRNRSTRATTFLDLTLTSKVSGEELGDVVCVIDSSGNLVSSVFEEAFEDLAVN